MIKVENSITINKSVEEVYTYVNNPENTAKWQSGVDSVEYQDTTQKVGTQYTEVRKFMGKEMKTALEVTKLEPNEVYAAKTLSGPVPYNVTVTFESVNGATKMTTMIEAEPDGFFKLAEGAVSKQLSKSLKEDSELLKEILESA
jgi:uncharacterized membrane protein